MNIIKIHCPFCAEETSCSVENEKSIVIVQKQEVEVEHPLYTCQDCGEEFESLDSDKEPTFLAREKYREVNGLLTVSKIKSFREQFGLSQKDYSLLCGFGEITITRYERGEIQSDVHNFVMESSMSSSGLESLLKKFGHKVSNKKAVERLIAWQKRNDVVTAAESNLITYYRLKAEKEERKRIYYQGLYESTPMGSVMKKRIGYKEMTVAGIEDLLKMKEGKSI